MRGQRGIFRPSLRSRPSSLAPAPPQAFVSKSSPQARALIWDLLLRPTVKIQTWDSVEALSPNASGYLWVETPNVGPAHNPCCLDRNVWWDFWSQRSDKFEYVKVRFDSDGCEETGNGQDARPTAYGTCMTRYDMLRCHISCVCTEHMNLIFRVRSQIRSQRAAHGSVFNQLFFLYQLRRRVVATTCSDYLELRPQ